MGQNIVMKGKIDGLSNKQFTSEYNIYDTMSVELENGQVTHLKRVIALGGMTSYLKQGFEGKIYIRKLNDKAHLILALEDANGKKVLDDAALKQKFKELKSTKNGSYFAMGLGVLLLPVFIGIFFIFSGLQGFGTVKRDCELFDINSIGSFLKKEGFQMT